MNIKNFLLSCILFMTFPVFSQTNVIEIKHTFYTNFYDTVLKIPIQTTYVFTSRNLELNYKRTPFTLDKRISYKYQTTVNTNTAIYDKGHLAPAADFRFDSLGEREVMYFTNQVPQVRKLNRGVWKGIENYVRLKGKYIDSNDSLVIKTGVIATSVVPEYFWKCIFYKNNTECFICKNTNPKSNVITDYSIKYTILQEKYKLTIR